MESLKIDKIIGKKIGQLKVESILEKGHTLKRCIFLCKCQCGNTCARKWSSIINAIRENLNSNCGCIFIGADRTDKEKQESITKCVFNSYKDSARKRNITFDLDLAFVKEIINKKCVYCGIEAGNRREGYKANKGFTLKYNGIDRSDNSVGYKEFNCVPCCGICNRSKFNLTKEDWQKYINRLIEYNT